MFGRRGAARGTAIELAADDPRLGLTGYAELVAADGGVRPHRLQLAAAAPPPPARLATTARMASGVAATFATDARALEWDVEMTAPEPGRRPAPFDVVVDGVPTARQLVRGSGTLRVRGLPRGVNRIRVWLPQYGFCRLGAVRLAGATTVASAADQRRWITYGSSITHCNGADGPSQTWPALVAARHGWRLTNLGFAGACHLDPVVARFIRDTPADLVSLCVGVNIHGGSTFDGRTLGPALGDFLATVRQGHPHTPLVVITPIVAPAREEARNRAGLTLSQIRTRVAETVLTARENGDRALHLVDGLGVLGRADTAALADGLHPGPDGYRLMAARIAPLLGPHLSG